MQKYLNGESSYSSDAALVSYTDLSAKRPAAEQFEKESIGSYIIIVLYIYSILTLVTAVLSVEILWEK